MPFDLEQTRRLQEIRQKSMANTATLDELKEAIIIMRQDRVRASTGSTISRTAKAKAAAPVNTTDLLNNLKALGANLKNQTHEG